MKKGDIDFQYTKNGVAVEWFDNSEVKRVGTCLEESNKISIIKSKRTEGQNTCPIPRDYQILQLRHGWC